MFQLTDVPTDFWDIKAGCLIRHHLHPRRALCRLQDFNTPIDSKLLDAVRTTVARKADGSVQVITDDGNSHGRLDYEWTGCTIYQISGLARKEMGMYANLSSKKVGREEKSKMMRQQKRTAKGTLNEKLLTAAERAQFQEAKCKELQSFFDNQVWEFSTVTEAPPERTLTARILTKWSKNPDGSPRAKARLIVRGYADVDALSHGLDTSSPTTSRLARSFVLSLTALLGWQCWTADVATAFLQGLPQTRKLWVKLPADALHLLGADPSTRMLLLKPCYGQLDAPRRWFLEAVRRLRELNLRQHPLDPCLFCIYESDFPQFEPSAAGTLGDAGLCGLIALHVDDLLGSGLETSATYQHVVSELKQVFNFREWKDGQKLEYCGATIEKLPDGGLKVNHETYIGKIKPMTLGKGLGPEAELSQKEVSQLRGLCGALQWPAVQSSPHLQASTSITSGSINAGKVGTATESNRTLRFAKENADVGLIYKPLCDVSKLRLVAMFDASFNARPDGSSQGGYMVILVPDEALTNVESWFHVLDWRSLKLPRVARSSLAAEAQAAAQAADSVDYVCRFWECLCSPGLRLAEVLQKRSPLRPVLITDAKALYDSYHRESVTANVTDRRIALEIRVIKELMQDLAGEMRWVSSERQWADGLTKLSARQLLADRLRHGRIGFFWDPQYTAAKKKSQADRQRCMDEHAAPPPQRLQREEDAMEDENPRINENLPEDEDTPNTNEVHDETYPEGNYVVYTSDILEYVDVTIKDTKEVLIYHQVEKFFPYFSYFGTLPIFVHPNMTWLWCAVAIFLIFVLFYLMVKTLYQRAFRQGYDAATEFYGPAARVANTFAIQHACFQEAMDAHDDRMRRFAMDEHWLREVDEQRDSAIPVMRRALLESFDHADICPLNDLVWVTDNDVWHCNPQCTTLPRDLNAANGVMAYRPCQICSSDIIAPYAPDATGHHLQHDLEEWITRQGAEAWPPALL